MNGSRERWYLGGHTHPPTIFASPSHSAPRVCVCSVGPFPEPPSAASPGLRAGTAQPPGPSGTWRRFWGKKTPNQNQGEIGSRCEAELPKRLTRLPGGAGWLSAAVSRAEVQALVRTGKKKKRKILHFSPPLPPFSPLCPSRDSPLPPQPTFSMTSFDEILQHRNLQASSAQDFLGVFWQDPVPAIQIASSDNKLRALPLRHNRFPQRSSKYLRVFISLLREG